MERSDRQASPKAEDPGRDERMWLAHSASLWRKARAIVTGSPYLDAGDVYHALRSLELPPVERLRRGLARVRVRPHAR